MTSSSDLVQPPEGHEPLDTLLITGWKEKKDFPHYEDFTEEMEKLSDRCSDNLVDKLSEKNYAGDKFGGWPTWVQSKSYVDCDKWVSK